MGKKKHGRGRGKQPHRRHLPPRATSGPQDGGPEDLELFVGIRQALRAGDPLALLMLASAFLELHDPRSDDPFSPKDDSLNLADLVESFIETSYAETTAALTAMRTLTTDEQLAARVGEELGRRRHPMPDWLTGLDSASVEADVWHLTDILGDGDDYLFGVTLPSGHALSALVYVDHNYGTAVKDGFVVTDPLEDLALRLGSLIETPRQSLVRTDAARSRAVVEAAIAHGAMFRPVLSSETWPMARPLIEWLLRHLPSGAPTPEPKEWTEEEQQAIADAFFASSFGAPLDSDDRRGVMQSLLWFATGYTSGDPYQWSPVRVEILLADWFPRKVVAEPAYLAQLPELLRAYVEYCHDRRGLPPELTRETLDAVDDWEPDYQRSIRSERLQGPAALAAAMMPERELDLADDDLSDDEWVDAFWRDLLESVVGGRVQLANLDATPLPDEPFEWAGIPDDIRPVVQEVLDLCDQCAEEFFDVEMRTAMRRFLSRAAVGDPRVFRRRASTARAAAAVAWSLYSANTTIAGGAGPLVGDLLTWFGVKGSISDRANTLLKAFGVDRDHQTRGYFILGAPDLLTSQARATVIMMRETRLGQTL